MAHRLEAMGVPAYRNGFEVTLQPQVLEAPLGWRRSRRVFVNSMSDLFHEDVPVEYVLRIFDVMRRASWHQFQILTKRSARIRRLDAQIDWPPNVWMGVSAETASYVHRIDDLRGSGARGKVLSLEPLLGPLPHLNLSGIDWVIAGGESGPHARPMDGAWVRDLRDQCHHAGVAFFFKQWGGTRKKTTGRSLDGRTHDEWPAAERALHR